MAKFMRNYLIRWKDTSTNEEILIGDTEWQKTEEWSYPKLLTINLDVNRNTFASSNECHLQILNLSKSNRQKMYHDRYDPAHVIYLDIIAGYGQDLSLIFRGKVLQSYSYMQGNDMITDIQALDIGFMTYIKDDKHVNYTNLTLEAGTSKQEAIKRIQTNMEETTQIGAIGKIGDTTYQTPVSFLGNCIYLIDEMTGGHVFVDLGKINVLSDKEVINIGKIPVINAETGLLGTPRRSGGQLELDILFEPSYIVGQAVKLETVTGINEFNGIFKIIGIHHSGTISAANCGTLTTRLNLWYGSKLPQTDSSEVQTEETFSQVNNTEVTPVETNEPWDCIDVYNYIQKNGVAPNKLVPNTTISWTTLITQGKPSLDVITKLAKVCELVQNIANKNFNGTPKIKVISGYRTASQNTAAGGVPTSLHLSGRAIDITAIGSQKDLRNIYKMFEPYHNQLREVLIEGGCVHVGIEKTNLTRGYWDKKIRKLRDVI